MGQLIWRSSTI